VSCIFVRLDCCRNGIAITGNPVDRIRQSIKGLLLPSVRGVRDVRDRRQDLRLARAKLGDNLFNPSSDVSAVAPNSAL